MENEDGASKKTKPMLERQLLLPGFTEKMEGIEGADTTPSPRSSLSGVTSLMFKLPNYELKRMKSELRA